MADVIKLESAAGRTPSRRAAGFILRLAKRPSFAIPAALVLLMIVIAIMPGAFAGWFGHGDPHDCRLALSLQSPSAGHPFGVDKQGCDVYANVIYGTRSSVTIGLLVTALSFGIAIVLGSVSGYFGGIVDAVISRFGDFFFGFPFILGALVLLTAFPARNVLTVSLVLAFFGWPALTRLMRASSLSVRSSDYVLAARGLGATGGRILRRHIVPNAISPVIVLSAISIGQIIATESTLTFLGVGLQSPAISWGLQLSSAQNDFQSHPHIVIFPAIFLTVTVLSFIILGDRLEEELDPRRNDG